VESILFGHQKGAFTSAFKQHRGVFEQAHNGTLLLDEIGELPVAVQPKLLQAIETGRVRPVGADKEISVDVRLLTATNRSLAREVSAGRFRQDLYYRLAGLELVLPPLRERLEDLPDLAQHIFHQLTHKHYEECRERFAARTISRAAQAKLSSHPWPGNVRELHHTLGRALILARGPAVEPEDISFPGWIEAAPEARSPEPPVLVQIPELDATFKEFKSALIERHERAYIERLMRRANGNQVQAAKMAGLARSYLKKLLARYGLRDQKPTP